MPHRPVGQAAEFQFAARRAFQSAAIPETRCSAHPRPGVVSAVRTIRPFSRARDAGRTRRRTGCRGQRTDSFRCCAAPGRRISRQSRWPCRSPAAGCPIRCDSHARPTASARSAPPTSRSRAVGFGALHIAGDPVEVVGGAAQHRITPPVPRCP